MAIVLAVYHSGSVETNDIGSHEFVGMKKEIFWLKECLTLANVGGLVRECLNWLEENCDVRFEGRCDIGSSNGPRIKVMGLVCTEKDWETYVEVVTKFEVHGLELVATRVEQNVVCDECSRLPMLPEVVDEHAIECPIPLTQPSQASVGEGVADDPPCVGSNEAVMNMEPDHVDGMGMLMVVDHEPINTASVEEEVLVDDDAAFADERAVDSDDDRPLPALSNRDKALLKWAVDDFAPVVPDCQDLSEAHRAVVDGTQFDDNVPLINNDNAIIQQGIVFKLMEALKIWLVEGEWFHHRLSLSKTRLRINGTL
jgi:hypothetical protein